MRLIVFISREDDFYNSARKIQDICKISSDVVYIEDFIANMRWNEITDSDIIYFLCNGEKVNYAFNKILSVNTKCEIINREYLLQNNSKLLVQQKISESGVPTPKIIDINDINNVKFPIFCKQNSHTGIVFKAYTRRTIIDFFQKFDIKDFYLEEAVTSDLEKHNEFKAYFANGNVYPKDGESCFDDCINDICDKISSSLYGLQAFSVDFIENNNGLYVIDVNVASGFYMSTGARKEFVKKYVNKGR